MIKSLLVLSFISAAVAAAILMMVSLGPGATAEGTAEQEIIPAVRPGQPIQQPINFSHKIHAGDVGIDCMYCHVGVSEGPVATVPAVQTCMGCHKLVGLGRPEIDKLTEFWNNKQPIPWIKVHDISDHVRFDHHRHVAAEIACQTCHGSVEEMDRIVLQQDLTMGFCIKCHKSMLNTPGTPTSLDCVTCHK